MTKLGVCHLCGRHTDLTKDHIQPQCAFNETKRRYIRIDRAFSLRKKKELAVSKQKIRGLYHPIQPNKPIFGGIYQYTQCSNCNSMLGLNYDARFGRWCNDALKKIKPGSIISVKSLYQQECKYPLSILKRIIAMFFSINGDKFATCNPGLSQFVLDKDSQNLPPKYRFFVAHDFGDIVSHIPLQYRGKVTDRGPFAFISQISHPPFVYSMTVDSSHPDNRPYEISKFSKFTYHDEANIKIGLKVVPTNFCYAGDHREAGKIIPNGYIVASNGEIEPSYFQLVDPIV